MIEPLTVSTGSHATGLVGQYGVAMMARSAAKNSTLNRNARLIDRVSTDNSAGIAANGRTAPGPEQDPDTRTGVTGSA